MNESADGSTRSAAGPAILVVGRAEPHVQDLPHPVGVARHLGVVAHGEQLRLAHTAELARHRHPLGGGSRRHEIDVLRAQRSVRML